MAEKFKFFAFISYSHADMKAAKKLQSLLESYNLPTKLKKKVKGGMPNKIRVFRDTDEFTSGELNTEMKKKLEVSKFLIVICSPTSAKSPFVGFEIDYFRSLGREQYIIPFIIDGKPDAADPSEQCFNPKLTAGGFEPLGISVEAETMPTKWLKFHKAFIRVVGAMLELDFGVLWNRRKHQFIQRVVVSTLLTVCVATAIAFFALRAQKEKPFDSVISLKESVITTLPLSDNNSDSLFVYLDKDDIRTIGIKSLNEDVSIVNIPGKYRNKEVRAVLQAFGCEPLDTVINIDKEVELLINRNEEIFGRVRYFVVDSDYETPVVGAIFDFGCVSGTTDEQGLLDVLIPLENQRDGGYEVKITYQNTERRVKYQPQIEPILDRDEVQTIMLD